MDDEERVVVCQREIRRLRGVVRDCEYERCMLVKYLQEVRSRKDLSSETIQILNEVYMFVEQGKE